MVASFRPRELLEMQVYVPTSVLEKLLMVNVRRVLKECFFSSITSSVLEMINENVKRARALVWWLWEETHVQNVVGSNPGTGYWMGIYHIYLL